MTAKMAALKAQLEKTLKSELTAVENQCTALVYFAGSVHELKGKKRKHYSNLREYRQDVAENLYAVQSWTVDEFVKQLHVDRTVHIWLGWN